MECIQGCPRFGLQESIVSASTLYVLQQITHVSDVQLLPIKPSNEIMRASPCVIESCTPRG